MRSVLLLLTATALTAVQSGIAEEDRVTNLRAYQQLSAGIGDSLGNALPQGDSLRLLLTIKPEGPAWMVQSGVAQSLQKHGWTVVVAQPAVYQAELGILDMRVVYGNVRAGGLFSAKVVDRSVLLSVAARLVDQRSGVIVVSREFQQALHDTVQVSEIQSLEDSNVPATQGVLPGEGFFSTLVEPLVLLAAVAVAVYLLFAVRS